MTSELDEKYPWARREDESSKAFKAFCAYRDLGAVRSIAKAYSTARGSKGDRKGIIPSRWRTWATQYEWVNRAREYDLHLELKARAEREQEHHQELQDFRERQKKLAIATTQSTLRLLELANRKITSLTKAYEDWKQKLEKAQTEEERAELMKDDPISIALLPNMIRAAASVAQVATDAEAQALAVNELLKILEDTKRHMK
ncbi:MAG: hypothetical protein L0Z53_04645 [Acidobacteriales bacterium]|nr:hypothetical protein [Terriglobales bacterium]